MSIPAAFNGLFSIKPSSSRISFRQVANSVGLTALLLIDFRLLLTLRQSPGQQTIPTTIGVFGLSISCLQAVFRALQEAEPWLHDPNVVELPWRYEQEILTGSEAAKSLSFGFFANDGGVTPHPPIQRAMRTVESALRMQGYNVC